jgi:uncharacterized membrane protein YeaQ/YmgE (transglycosylase-associated protein family)
MDELIGLIIFLAIGALAGYMASFVMGRRRGSGGGRVVRDIIVGVIGAFVGGYLFRILGISEDNLLMDILTAFVGAVIVIFVARRLV